MTEAIEKLLSIASGPVGPPIGLGAELGSALGNELAASVLSRINGFYAFESALHVHPLTTSIGSHGIDSWNAPDLWRDRYQGLADDLLCFAEDIFGGQFAIKGDAIVSFEPETGEVTEIAGSIAGWARKILDDYEVITGYPIARQWQAANGALARGERLIPKRPFVMGGEYSVENLFAVEAVEGMRFRGDIAVQIRDLPDGASITFKIVD